MMKKLIEQIKILYGKYNERTLLYGENSMEELKQYKENSYYNTEDIAEQLIELSNLDMPEELKTELENALYWIRSAAQNEYNNDYFRVLYNVLLVITGNETF